MNSKKIFEIQKRITACRLKIQHLEQSANKSANAIERLNNEIEKLQNLLP